MATFDPESVLVEGAHLKRLARDLVAGAADAEDVVQETWLRALVKPARSEFSLRSWLSGLLKNVAREHRRAELRRDAREQIVASRPGSVLTSDRDDPAAVAERFDLLRRVLALVDALPEPQRTTLLRRYLDGLEPSEIARRENVPDATVRSRIKRGLDELRARLDAEHRGSRASWMAVLIQWSRPPALAVAGTSSALLGGLLVKIASTKVAAALLVALAAGVAVVSWSLRAPERLRIASTSMPNETPALAPPPPAMADATARRKELPPAVAASTAATSSAAESDAAPGWRLEGVLHGLDPAIPWTGSIRATLVVSPWSDDDPPSYSARLDAHDEFADGRFSIALPLECRDALSALSAKEGRAMHWRGLKVCAEDPDYVDVEQYVDVLDATGAAHAPPFSFHVELKTRPSAHVHGRVVDERGNALGGVTVAWDADSGGAERQDATTDSFGRYRLESASVGRTSLRAWAAQTVKDGVEQPPPAPLQDLTPTSVLAECTPGADTALADIVMRQGATIEGRVFGASGDPEPAAIVTAWPAPREPDPPPAPPAAGTTVMTGEMISVVRSSDERAPVFEIERHATCDDEGAFRLTGLKPGGWLVAVAGRGTAAVHPVVTNDRFVTATPITAPAHDVEIVDPLALVRLHVTLRGAPVSQAALTIQGTSLEGDTSDLGGRTDANGDFEFLGRDSGRYQLWVHDRSDVESSSPPFHLDKGDVDRRFVIELEPRRPRASIALHLHDATGAKVTRAWLRAVPSTGEADAIERNFDSEDGTFSLTDVPLGTYRLLVRPGAGVYGTGGFFEEQSLDVTLAEPVRSEVSLDVHPTGRIQVRVVDPEGNGISASLVLSNLGGQNLPISFARVEANSASYSPDHTFADGCFVTPSPPPGRYHLSFSAGGFFSKTVDTEVRPGESTDLVVTLLHR